MLVEYVSAIAYHVSLNLLGAFSQPGASTLADVCMSHYDMKIVPKKLGQYHDDDRAAEKCS